MCLNLALVPGGSFAQGFTSSATLTASIQGTNLVVNYSLTTTQGWATLFQADRMDRLASNAQPVDLAPVLELSFS